MSELGEALMERMGHIVFLENRPFSYLDFIPKFEVNGKEYSVGYGTLRNQFSKLRGKGEIELDYRTSQAFYTLGGQHFGKRKPMTFNHMRGAIIQSSDPIVKMLHTLPTQGNALHDIRLRFSVKGIWSILSARSTFRTDPYSKDISLQPYRIGDLRIRVTIHKTDTVTVIVGCSYSPIAVDISGIIRLSNALTRVEERLTRLLSAEGGGGNNLISVPEYHRWDVTMWHFGADGSKEYVGDKFCVTWEVAEHALVRAYSKQMPSVRGNVTKTRTIIRLERQEYPGKTFEAAIAEKLGVASDYLL